MSEHKKTIEEVMELYAKEEEAKAKVNGTAPVTESPANKVPKQKSFQEEAEELVASRPSLKEAQDIRRAEILEQTKANRLGYIELSVKDLPSGGIFYPEGTKMFVRSASGEDIKQWSMTNDEDITAIDDAINAIIERCVSVSTPDGSETRLTWKDVKELDRLYLLFAIRDFTFIDGHNELKVVVDEGTEVVVKKDNITFVDFPEGIYKYYNETERCFSIPSKTPGIGNINFYLPSTGVNQWLRNYILNKRQNQEGFDESFIQIAPILIKDYRKLNAKSYTDLYLYSNKFSGSDWAVINHVWKTIRQAVAPKVNYTDDGGVEHTAPLNFRGGILSIFVPADAVEELGF